MAEVQQNRWDRIIRRVSGSVGTRSHVSETLTELFPVLDVERVPGELLLLGGTRIGFGGRIVTMGLLEFAKVQLFNPADSSTIATITRVIFRTASTTEIRWTLDDAPREDTASSERQRDSRAGISAATTCKIFSEGTVTALPAIGITTIQADTPFVLEDPNGVAVLGPGTGFTIGSNTINVEVTATFYWRERQAEQSELQF